MRFNESFNICNQPIYGCALGCYPNQTNSLVAQIRSFTVVLNPTHDNPHNLDSSIGFEILNSLNQPFNMTLVTFFTIILSENKI